MPRTIRTPKAAQPRRGLAVRALVTLVACASLQWTPAAIAGQGKRAAAAPLTAAAQETASRAPASLGSEAALRAVALVGVPYRWGGSRTATGLDCSGLVHHVFSEIGVATPRDTRGLARSGDTVARRSLQPGDLVFFNTLVRAWSNVARGLGRGAGGAATPIVAPGRARHSPDAGESSGDVRSAGRPASLALSDSVASFYLYSAAMVGPRPRMRREPPSCSE